MNSIVPRLLLPVILSLPFAACSTTEKTALYGAPSGGNTFTGTVVESTPDRITIKIKDQPQLLVLEGSANHASVALR